LIDAIYSPAALLGVAPARHAAARGAPRTLVSSALFAGWPACCPKINSTVTSRQSDARHIARQRGAAGAVSIWEICPS
jgi:hypothetical protein